MSWRLNEEDLAWVVRITLEGDLSLLERVRLCCHNFTQPDDDVVLVELRVGLSIKTVVLSKLNLLLDITFSTLKLHIIVSAEAFVFYVSGGSHIVFHLLTLALNVFLLLVFRVISAKRVCVLLNPCIIFAAWNQKVSILIIARSLKTIQTRVYIKIVSQSLMLTVIGFFKKVVLLVGLYLFESYSGTQCT